MLWDMLGLALKVSLALAVLQVVSAQSFETEYQGCLRDSFDRRLPGLGAPSANMSVALCRTRAAVRGFSVYALQYGVECYAGMLRPHALAAVRYAFAKRRG
jgi:hypothetical protein